MICPKCGQEYTGDSCPRCQGPKIIVNNQEYLQRKMEYEKKQAEVKSASSSHGKNPSDETEKKNSTLPGQELKPDEVFKKIVDKARKEGKTASEGVLGSASNGKAVKLVKKILILVIALTVIFISSGTVVKLVKRNNQTLYVRYNGKIYNMSGIDSVYVCDSDKAYFDPEGRNFYTPDEPADIVGKTVTEKLSSENGKYFVSEVYDQGIGKYTLYLWNNDVNYKLSENSNKKSVIYVSDEGNVVYKETVMINDVGGMGNTGLYLSQLVKGESGLIPAVTQLSEQIRQACVYSDKKLIIYNTGEDTLYSFCYGRDKTERVIAEDVTAIYPVVSGKKGYYSYRAEQINTDKDVSSLVYVSGGKAWLYDCLDKNETAVEIDSATGGTSEYIITNSNGIYSAGSSVLRYASFKNEKNGEYSDVLILGNTANIVYFSEKDILIAVASDGRLVSVNKGIAKDITDAVTEGSLSEVDNTDNGITYIRNAVLYYANVSSLREMVMSEAGSNVSTSGTLMYKNRLFYCNDKGSLCSCTVSGKDDKIIGEVDNFWLGK